MSWVEDIGNYLEDQGIGTLDTDIFYNGFDATTQNCIALFEQTGQKEEGTASNDSTLRYPELGIRVRNALQSQARNKAFSICNLLREVCNTQIGSTYFTSIEPIADPFYVPQSKSTLYIYSVNFSLEIEGL